MNVVHIAIPIVVNPVARDFSGISPHVRGEILVVELDPAIDDTDVDIS